MLTVPAEKFTVPAPVTLEVASRSCVPPEKSSVAPDETAKVPLSLPPPPRLSVPLLIATVPLLLNDTLLPIVVVVPAPVLLNVPELLKAATPVPPYESVTVAGTEKVPEGRLLIAAPLPAVMPPPVHEPVPELL